MHEDATSESSYLVRTISSSSKYVFPFHRAEHDSSCRDGQFFGERELWLFVDRLVVGSQPVSHLRHTEATITTESEEALLQQFDKILLCCSSFGSSNSFGDFFCSSPHDDHPSSPRRITSFTNHYQCCANQSGPISHIYIF